jgi:hypothetical protein
VNDDVLTAFLRRNAKDVADVVAASDVAHLALDRGSVPPRRIHGLFSEIEYFTRGPGGTFPLCRRPLPFVIDYPDDYCACVDGTLQLRVARILAPIAHPNIAPGGAVCLGPTFRPSTPLRSLLEHLHRICSGRVFATESPWEAETAAFFCRHPERVRALRGAPLWRKPLARRVQIEPIEPSEPIEPTAGGSR